MVKSEEKHPQILAAEVDDLWKSYAGIPVLKGVNIGLRSGEIHALVGGNGAGKSTLMKCLTGIVTPDSGQIFVSGKEVKSLSPRTAHENRIYMVPQEPKLFPNLSVFENISLSLQGVEYTKDQLVDVCSTMASHIDLKRPASELSISDQQIIEIIRGILRDAKVLIVDEPTAALTDKETDILFTHLRDLASSGVGIFYVTHRMNEIFELCDYVTVLKDGYITAQMATSETNASELVSLMIPKRESTREEKPQEVILGETPCIEVNNLSGQGFKDITFSVFPGEIVGIAGVVGSGRTELAESIYGLRKSVGEILICGKEYNNRSPKKSLDIGVSYVAEDRHKNGVFLLSSIVDNTTSSILDSLSRFGFINKRKEIKFVEKLTTDLDLQKGSLQRKVGNLSGGNQQKISLAKSLASNPKVIILDEPSRGVDVGARADLYSLIADLRLEGCGVIVISSDFKEIEQIATRVLVMNQGQIVKELVNREICLEKIRDYCFELDVETEEASA